MRLEFNVRVSLIHVFLNKQGELASPKRLFNPPVLAPGWVFGAVIFMKL